MTLKELTSSSMCVMSVNMKTVTTREVQHHFSKVLESVEAGERVKVTRRGLEVAVISPVEIDESQIKKVDWKEALARRERVLGDLPSFEHGIVEEMRKDERY